MPLHPDPEEFVLHPLTLNNTSLLKELCNEIRKIPKTGTKIISLIGGPASGKTTLAHQLAKKLTSTAIISTDDYVIQDREYRRKYLEGKNPLKKYDPAYLNQKIQQICTLKSGQTVKVSTYNEETGLAIAQGEENYTPPYPK